MISETLYAKYIKERMGRDIIEVDGGFITYRCANGECFMADMYVEQSKRGGLLFKKLIEQLSDIAKEAGCSIITATIHIADPGCSHNLASALKIGFKVLKAEHGVVLVGKEV